jgi:putative ABC transport system permease protein
MDGGRKRRYRPVPVAYTHRETLARLRTIRASIARSSRVRRWCCSAARAGSNLRATLEPQGYVIQSSQLKEQGRQVMEDHMLMVAGFLGIMSQLMIVVGGLGLASTMSLAVLERTREIGIMRALGARHRTIFALIQVEGLVVAVASWLLALPLSVPMSIVLGRAFGRIMFPVPVVAVPGIGPVMIWLAVAVGVSIAACAWPAIRATRLTTRAALAYE